MKPFGVFESSAPPGAVDPAANIDCIEAIANSFLIIVPIDISPPIDKFTHLLVAYYHSALDVLG
jgi:hypothetical protein